MEEKFWMYFTTENFDIFRHNENQIFPFIYDLLFVLDALNLFKIKLMTESLHIAIDNRSYQRWRFRIDNIGLFIYFKGENKFENYSFFRRILLRLLDQIKDPKINIFLKDFIELLDNLKRSMQHDFIKVLIEMIKPTLVSADMENEILCYLYSQNSNFFIGESLSWHL